MKNGYSKLKKTLIITIGSIIIAMIVVIILFSIFTKYWIEKYDKKYLGRQIKMERVYANPFTGYIYISDLKIYESKNQSSLNEEDSIFFSIKGLSANVAMFKLLSKTIEITKLTLNQPKLIIIQSKRDFNFNDLIKLFTPEKLDTTPSSFHLNILNIKIENGEFFYREKETPINYFIKNVNIESTGIHEYTDTTAIKFSFLPGIGTGNVKGNITINLKNMDYHLAIVTHKLDLNIIDQYLQVLVNYGHLRANLDANYTSKGNFNNPEGVTNSGKITINDFHFGENPNDDYASFDKLMIKINEISPKKHIYFYDTILLINPYIKYDLYDNLDNLQMIFGEKGANISAAKKKTERFNLIIKIADYMKILSKNFFLSNYKINKLMISHGCLEFNDYSVSEKFSIELNPLYIVADSIYKNREHVKIYLKSGINPYGIISANLSINPKDSTDFDFRYHIQNLSATTFNPYMISYTSYPLDGGTIELNGSWKARNKNIKCDNHLVIIDPHVTKRIINKDTKWAPLHLIMHFVREHGNIIDYEIPISGNLDDPDFHLLDIFFEILNNIFSTPSTTQYKKQIKKTENKIENSVTWEMRQNLLLPSQKRFINKLIDFLKNNPEASIDVYPILYNKKEKEYICFFEAKKKYFLLFKDKNAQFLSKDDSLIVDKMSAKDSLFVDYLNKHIRRSNMLFTIQDKCSNYIGLAITNAKFKQLNKEREEAFMMYFKKKGLENRVKIHKEVYNVPYDGFSFYKIVYR